MSKEANELLHILLASRIDAAGAHCVQPAPGDGDPDDGDGDPDQPPGDDSYPGKPGPAESSSAYYA